MEEFERIYSEYYEAVFRYTLSLCGDPQWAEEITQETFFKALKAIDGFRGDCKLRVWLCQIAKNTLFSEQKRRKRETGDFSELTFRLCEGAEEAVVRQDTARRIFRFLDSLEEPYGEVFRARAIGELSFREIGELFGKTENWARVTYYRAKVKIKEGIQ